MEAISWKYVASTKAHSELNLQNIWLGLGSSKIETVDRIDLGIHAYSH